MNESEYTTPPVKTCTKCGRKLSATPDLFYRQHDGKYGLRADCKECFRPVNHAANSSRYAKQRAERLANPQPVDKTGWPPCPYCREPMRPKATSLGDRKRCSKLECKKAYQNDRCREFLRDWTKTHGQSYGLTKYPEERRAYRRQRRAREHNAPGSYTDADVQAQYARQRGKCYWQTSEPCKARSGKLGDDYQPDHVVPLILGGSNWPSNLVVSCSTCNYSKAGQHPMDWAGVMF